MTLSQLINNVPFDATTRTYVEMPNSCVVNVNRVDRDQNIASDPTGLWRITETRRRGNPHLRARWKLGSRERALKGGAFSWE